MPEPVGAAPSVPVKMMVADVDGTLVTPDKELTDAAIGAVAKLHDAGIVFAVTSGRPPRGMSMLIEPLHLTTPIAAFNGGLFAKPDMSVIEQRLVPDRVTTQIVKMFRAEGLDVWIYRGAEWFVTDRDAPHVAREAWTVRFEPTVVDDVATVAHDVAKVVGVSDDHELVSTVAERVRERFGDHVSAAPSQPYYLDVTHPEANKGSVVRYLSETFGIPLGQIATIGDMPNDVLMFAHVGLSIAMGNASGEVQRAARRVTATNQEEGFAKAVERFVLPR